MSLKLAAFTSHPYPGFSGRLALTHFESTAIVGSSPCSDAAAASDPEKSLAFPMADSEPVCHCPVGKSGIRVESGALKIWCHRTIIIRPSGSVRSSMAPSDAAEDAKRESNAPVSPVADERTAEARDVSSTDVSDTGASTVSRSS